IDDPQDFVKVAASAHRITELHLDLLVWADYEHGADRGVVIRRAALRTVTGRGGQHSIQLGDLQLRVADHWIIHLPPLRLLDIGLPLHVIADWIDADSEYLRVALGKLRLQLGH